MVEWHWQGKINVREQKPVLFLLGIKKISHGLAWNRTRVATMTARRRVSQELCSIECDKTFKKEKESFGPHMLEATINTFSRLCPFRELNDFLVHLQILPETISTTLKLKAAVTSTRTRLNSVNPEDCSVQFTVGKT